MAIDFPFQAWAALVIEGQEQPPRRPCFLILEEQPDRLVNLHVDRMLGFDVPETAKGGRGSIKYFTAETGDDWIMDCPIEGQLHTGLVVVHRQSHCVTPEGESNA